MILYEKWDRFSFIEIYLLFDYITRGQSPLQNGYIDIDLLIEYR